MPNDKAIVCRIRPMSWKLFVQGRSGVQYVRRFLSAKGMRCSQPVEEPELYDPPVYSILVHLAPETPLTAQELGALLTGDEGIEVAFEDAKTAGASRNR